MRGKTAKCWRSRWWVWNWRAALRRCLLASPNRRLFIVIAGTLGLLQAAPAGGVPVSVTVAGSLQSELGCPGDWQPDCATTHLPYDAADDVWQGVFVVSAGNWEYKAALDDSWSENYGANGVPGGANIALSLG